MKYVIIAMLIVSLSAGVYIGSQLFPRSDVRTITTPATVKTVIQTKIIERLKDGTVVERVVVETKDEVKASPQPAKPDYRLGALIPLSNDRLPTVSASKRLFGSVWADAQYDLRHKEITLGVSLEF